MTFSVGVHVCPWVHLCVFACVGDTVLTSKEYLHKHLLEGMAGGHRQP